MWEKVQVMYAYSSVDVIFPIILMCTLMCIAYIYFNSEIPMVTVVRLTRKQCFCFMNTKVKNQDCRCNYTYLAPDELFFLSVYVWTGVSTIHRMYIMEPYLTPR